MALNPIVVVRQTTFINIHYLLNEYLKGVIKIQSNSTMKEVDLTGRNKFGKREKAAE